MQLNRVEPEKQILAEFSRGDFGGKIRVGGGDEAHISVIRARRTDALEFTGLNRPQHLGLLAQRDVPDFIEEQGAPIRKFEAPSAIDLGVGECAAHVTEEFTLKNALGQAAHVDGDKRFARTE